MTTRLLIGERSNKKPGQGDLNKILASPTRARLDLCHPTWEADFVTRNIWEDIEDTHNGKRRIQTILDEVEPDIIVTLGITVSLLLDVPQDTPWLCYTKYKGIPVLKFPHPSGRSRLWNDDAFAKKAAAELVQIATTGDTIALSKSRSAAAMKKPETKEPVPTEHIVSDIRHFKVENVYAAACSSCGWSITGPKKSQVEDDIDWHIKHAPKPKRRRAT